jgi:glycosyltransferase involved in cell wall biosynthesis
MPSNVALVSVIIPAHRDDDYLQQSIDSILKQTYKNIEILLLDNSEQAINQARFLNSQVRYIRTNPDWNISQILNFGFEVAQGKYLARMDSDDYAVNTRIAKQVEFLERNREIGVVGSAVEILSEVSTGKWKNGNVLHQPLGNNEIRKNLFIKNPFFHPTVMFRRSEIPKNPYNEGYNRAQDYRLWVRLYGKTQFANLPEPLLKYRFHSLQVGFLEQETSKASAEKARFVLGIKTVITNDENQSLGITAIKRYSRILLKKLWFTSGIRRKSHKNNSQ